MDGGNLVTGVHPDRAVIIATIDDAEHFSPEDRAKIIASYSPHEREARAKGIPVLGSGRIFPIPEEDIACDVIRDKDIPKHWKRLGAMDFGWDHPFAAVELLWDSDADVVYVARTLRQRQLTPAMASLSLKKWGDLTWHWPMDGGRDTQEGAGKALADQFGAEGLKMWHEHAQFRDGSRSVEAGLMEMLDRMQTGRFKVFRHLSDWFEEFRLYHREDGKIVKLMDDLMSATRYGVMMLRYARVVKDPEPSDRYKRKSAARSGSAWAA
jgi:hypothetical protein